MPPCIPELGPAMHKQKERLAGLPRLDVVYPHPINSDVLVFPIPGVLETGGDCGPGFDSEQSPACHDAPDEGSQEHGQGNEEPDQDCHQSQPLHNSSDRKCNYCCL